MSQIPGLEGGLIVNQKGKEQEQPHMASQALGKLHKGRLYPPILKTVSGLGSGELTSLLFPSARNIENSKLCLCVCERILNTAVDQTI